MDALKKMVRLVGLAILRRSARYRKYSHIPRSSVDIEHASALELLCRTSYPLISRCRPEAMYEPVYWKFIEALQERPVDTFVARARNFRVWGNQGAVITEDGLLLSTVSREFEKKDHTIFKQVKLVPPVSLPGRSVILAASGGDMYYHWMVDILPRLKLVRDCGQDKNVSHYIIPYHGLPFQRETLETLHIDPEKIVACNDHFDFHIIADELIIPSLPSRLDVVAPWACRFLADSFLGRPPKTGMKKIYLKRSGKRKITNAIFLEAFLLSKGYIFLECEKSSVSEQAAFFHNAEVILGPHGAAFTNIVFCRPGTKIVELFSPDWINPCYWTICQTLSLTYHYLIGEGSAPAQVSDAKGTNTDITIDMHKVEELFDRYAL